MKLLAAISAYALSMFALSTYGPLPLKLFTMIITINLISTAFATLTYAVLSVLERREK